MNNDTPAVDLDALLDGIKTAVQAAFPTLQTVDDYYRLQEKVPVPAVALEITGIEPDGIGDSGTEQFAAIVSLSAYCLVSYKFSDGQKAKRRAATLAGSVAALVKEQTWGCPVQLATEINGVPDVFPHNFKEYECWRVDWKHACYLGTSVWEDDTATVATEIFLGAAPRIGPGHEADYWQIANEQVPADFDI